MGALDSTVTDLKYDGEKVVERNAHIYETVLHHSSTIGGGNFDVISTADLERLFELYDESFFSGRIARTVREKAAELRFRLSTRMTSAGGKTTRIREKDRGRGRRGAGKPREVYEIAISTPLLYQSFRDIEASVTVSGIVCRDRLEALQRVFEHELIHLVEMLVWGDSSCSKARFKQLVRNLFGHTDVKHRLVSQRKRAQVHYHIRVGDRVSFDHRGRRHIGVVRRITKRATVFVESKKGIVYADGKRYVKYYVPLAMLAKA